MASLQAQSLAAGLGVGREELIDLGDDSASPLDLWDLTALPQKNEVPHTLTHTWKNQTEDNC
jgi:hypothetical protein